MSVVSSSMFSARQTLKRPAGFDLVKHNPDIIDLCSNSSGDETGGTCSAAEDSDSMVSEDSDSEVDDAAGAAALWPLYILFLLILH